jgi:hypothetical protein
MAQAEAYAAELMAQVQVKTQQMIAEIQRANQPPPEPENEVEELNAGGSFDGLQGADMRGGSMPAMQTAPGEGREQINGEDMMGEQLA